MPITVEGEVWGALSATAAGPPIPAGAERRLIPFADLVAAAIAAAQYRSELLASRGRHDRVAANDGRLTISSPPGQGTHVQALLPTS